jgi:hypothetical protein
MVIERLIGSIRRRSREEWERIPRDLYLDGRAWVQANPERAAGAAFLVGIVLVLAFKLVFTVLFLAFAAALVVWQIALPASEQHRSSEPPSEGKSS